MNTGEEANDGDSQAGEERLTLGGQCLSRGDDGAVGRKISLIEFGKAGIQAHSFQGFEATFIDFRSAIHDFEAASRKSRRNSLSRKRL